LLDLIAFYIDRTELMGLRSRGIIFYQYGLASSNHSTFSA
jgi:hypothetical protein